MLTYCDPDECLMYEQHWIDHYDAANHEKGYNMCPVAGNTMGRETSEETKRKIASKLIGQVLSGATRAKISLAGIGRVYTEQARENMRVAQRDLATRRTQEYKDNLSKVVAESNRRRKGEKRPGMSLKMTGRKMPDWVKEKIAATKRAKREQVVQKSLFE